MKKVLIVMGRVTWEVSISQVEYDAAALVGSQRQLDAIMKGHKNRAGTSRSEINDELAAIGEYVASVATGKKWTGSLGEEYPDLEGGYEVKTATKPTGRLRVYPYDDKKPIPDDIIHILVTPTKDHLVWTVQGWLTAGEARKIAPKDDPGRRNLPIHLVDQYLLTGMDKLPNLL